jgi:hypothetical protein
MSGKSANDADVASGLRLPSAVRARSFFFFASKAFLPWALPLAGLWAQETVHSNGLDPVRIIRLKERRPLEGR